MIIERVGQALRFTAASCVAAATLALPARADLDQNLSNVVFEVQVSNSLGSGSFSVTQDMGMFIGNSMFIWSLPAPVNILDANQNVIATLGGASVTYVGDPQIAMGFSIMAGGLDTAVTVNSGLLSFDKLVDTTGLVSAGLTLTDSNGNGGTLTGIGNNVLASYQYNGQAPGGTSFVDLTGALNALPGQSAAGSASTGGFIPIGDSISDMSFQYSFNLSAGDQASGTSNYVIMGVPLPAPGGLAMVACLGWFGRRRRRE
jgi:hypothetical protein